MSISPYGSPLPHGRWALSFAILLGGFFVAAEGGCGETADAGRDNTSESATAPGAHHTDQEADQAQHTGSRGNRTSLFDAVLCEERTDPTGGEEKDGRSRRAALAAGTPPPSSSFSPFPFASAAMGAASAATRSHLDVGTAAERRRLEREAFRVAVHEHIRRELLKAYVEDTRAFEALGDAE